MIWLILFIIVIIVACFVVYKTAEVHELHKIRAAFDIKRHNIEKLIQDRKNDSDFNNDYYLGALDELEEVETIIDENIHLFKYFDLID